MTIQRSMPAAVPSYLQTFVDAFDKGDSLGLCDLFAEDAVLDCGGGHLAVGRQAIRSALSNFLIHGLSLDFDVLCTIEAGDVSCVKTEWSLRGMNKMNQMINLTGRALHIFTWAPESGWKLKIYNPFIRAD